MTEIEDRLRRAVRRRMAELKIRTLEELAEKADIRPRTLNNVLAGQPTRAEDALELALGWTHGSIRRVREGGEPDLEHADRAWAVHFHATDRRKLLDYVTKRAAEIGRSMDEVLTEAGIEPVQWRLMIEDPTSRWYFDDLDRLDRALHLRPGALRLQFVDDVDVTSYDLDDVPVGAGVDPELLAEAADLDAEAVRDVIGYMRVIKARGRQQQQ